MWPFRLHIDFKLLNGLSSGLNRSTNVHIVDSWSTYTLSHIHSWIFRVHISNLYRGSSHNNLLKSKHQNMIHWYVKISNFSRPHISQYSFCINNALGWPKPAKSNFCKPFVYDIKTSVILFIFTISMWYKPITTYTPSISYTPLI